MPARTTETPKQNTYLMLPIDQPMEIPSIHVLHDQAKRLHTHPFQLHQILGHEQGKKQKNKCDPCKGGGERNNQPSNLALVLVLFTECLSPLINQASRRNSSNTSARFLLSESKSIASSLTATWRPSMNPRYTLDGIQSSQHRSSQHQSSQHQSSHH